MDSVTRELLLMVHALRVGLLKGSALEHLVSINCRSTDCFATKGRILRSRRSCHDDGLADAAPEPSALVCCL